MYILTLKIFWFKVVCTHMYSYASGLLQNSMHTTVFTWIFEYNQYDLLTCVTSLAGEVDWSLYTTKAILPLWVNLNSMYRCRHCINKQLNWMKCTRWRTQCTSKSTTVRYQGVIWKYCGEGGELSKFWSDELFMRNSWIKPFCRGKTAFLYHLHFLIFGKLSLLKKFWCFNK